MLSYNRPTFSSFHSWQRLTPHREWTCKACVKQKKQVEQVQPPEREIIVISSSSSVGSRDSSPARALSPMVAPPPLPVASSKAPKPWDVCCHPGCSEKPMNSGKMGILMCNAHFRMLNPADSEKLTAVHDKVRSAQATVDISRLAYGGAQARRDEAQLPASSGPGGLATGRDSLGRESLTNPATTTNGSSDPGRGKLKPPGEKKLMMKRTGRQAFPGFTSPPSSKSISGLGHTRPIHSPPRSPGTSQDGSPRKKQKLGHQASKSSEECLPPVRYAAGSYAEAFLPAYLPNVKNKLQGGTPPKSLPSVQPSPPAPRPGSRPDDASGSKKTLASSRFAPIRKMAGPPSLPKPHTSGPSSPAGSRSPSTGFGGKEGQTASLISRVGSSGSRVNTTVKEMDPKPGYSVRSELGQHHSSQRRSDDEFEGSGSTSSGKGDKSTSAGTEESALTTPEATPQAQPLRESGVSKAPPFPKTVDELDMSHFLEQGSMPKPTRPELRKPRVDMDSLDALIYRQEGASRPPPEVKVKLDVTKVKEQDATPSIDAPQPQSAPHYGHIDPRIHWPQPHSAAWHEAKQEEIQARGGRKARLGKAAESLRKVRSQENSLKFEDTLPEKIQDDPDWVRFIKKMSGIDEAPTPVPKKRGKPGPKPKKFLSNHSGL
jgi:hypothetical protein